MDRMFSMLCRVGCLCFFSLPMATWADSLTELAAQRSAEMSAGKATLDAQASLIEQAWSCDPVLYPALDEGGLVAWKFRQVKEDGSLESVDEGMVRLANTLVEFRSCKGHVDDLPIREAFLNKYVCRWEPYLYLIDSFKREAPTKLVRLQLCKRSHNDPDYFVDKNNHKADIQKRQLQARQEQLKSGAIAISSFNDAALSHDRFRFTIFALDENLHEVMLRPFLKPNHAVYSGTVVIDGEEGGALRVRVGGGQVWGQWVDVAYAMLRISKKSVNYSQQAWRKGNPVRVIGRYVGNNKYTTVAGEGRVMPVIDVMYVDDPR